MTKLCFARVGVPEYLEENFRESELQKVCYMTLNDIVIAESESITRCCTKTEIRNLHKSMLLASWNYRTLTDFINGF